MFKSIRYAMVIDTLKCVACGACALACKSENGVPQGYQRNWVVQEVKGHFPVLSMENRSERCQHCENPPCVAYCPTTASRVEDGGIVTVKQSLCTGCKACIAACPYDARFVLPQGVVDKCTFCIHRVRKGRLPACVEICPTHCLHFGDRNDPNSKVSKLLETREYKLQKNYLGTGPQLYWLI